MDAGFGSGGGGEERKDNCGVPCDKFSEGSSAGKSLMMSLTMTVPVTVRVPVMVVPEGTGGQFLFTMPMSVNNNGEQTPFQFSFDPVVEFAESSAEDWPLQENKTEGTENPVSERGGGGADGECGDLLSSADEPKKEQIDDIDIREEEESESKEIAGSTMEKATFSVHDQGELGLRGRGDRTYDIIQIDEEEEESDDCQLKTKASLEKMTTFNFETALLEPAAPEIINISDDEEKEEMAGGDSYLICIPTGNGDEFPIRIRSLEELQSPLRRPEDGEVGDIDVATVPFGEFGNNTIQDAASNIEKTRIKITSVTAANDETGLLKKPRCEKKVSTSTENKKNSSKRKKKGNETILISSWTNINYFHDSVSSSLTAESPRVDAKLTTTIAPLLGQPPQAATVENDVTHVKASRKRPRKQNLQIRNSALCIYKHQ